MQQIERPSRAAMSARLRIAGCVFAEDEARLLDEAAADTATLLDLLNRRVAGEPLEPLLGWVEFAGIRLEIGPGVFVPRRRTAALAAEAARFAALTPDAVVVDLCCGIGAIAAVVGARTTPRRLVAADLDPGAVAFARRNLAASGGEAYAGDLYDALPRKLLAGIDVLAVNAPYVPSAEIETMPREARDHEPRLALDGGLDGLDLHRRVAEGAPAWLAPGGQILIESSAKQAAATAQALASAGLAVRIARDDDLEATFVVGRAAG